VGEAPERVSSPHCCSSSNSASGSAVDCLLQRCYLPSLACRSLLTASSYKCSGIVKTRSEVQFFLVLCILFVLSRNNLHNLCIFIVMSMYSYCMFMYLHRSSWHSSATLTEVFLCFFLSCKASARVTPVKMGHSPHSSKIFVLFCVLFVLCCSMYCLCVNVYCTAATGWIPNCS
jgi:hypothetical protein